MSTDTTYEDAPPITGPSAGVSWKHAATAARRLLRRLLKPIVRSYWQRHTVRELSELPSYILRDIGLEAHDIHEVAGDLARDRAEDWARHARGANGFGG